MFLAKTYEYEVIFGEEIKVKKNHNPAQRTGRGITFRMSNIFLCYFHAMLYVLTKGSIRLYNIREY
jgi:hypothetical protein